MAITINTNPTSPNISNSDIIFVVQSDRSANPQFQFVCDIKDNNDNLIQRIKQQPNPNSKAVFNIGTILDSQLGPTDQCWETNAVRTNVSCSGQFKIYFGEEYGTSLSSSVTSYTGVGATEGQPAATGSLYYLMLDGVYDYNNTNTSWNWPSSSKLDYEDAMDLNAIFSHQNGLTNFDTNKVRQGDYHTISILNGNSTGDVDNQNAAQDVYAMVRREYDVTGSLLDTISFPNLTTTNDGGGPRANGTQTWDEVYNSQTNATKLVHWGVGPQNFAEIGYGFNANTSYYTISLVGQGDVNYNISASYGEYTFTFEGAPQTTTTPIPQVCGYNGVRFAWKNEYGVWDYYNFTLQSDEASGIDRKNYNQSYIDYAGGDPQPDNGSERGDTQYYNKITKRRTANSNWLTQEEADLLRELFYSTNVWVQTETWTTTGGSKTYGLNWEPAIITTANIVEKTNPRTQKNFQYQIEFQPANQPRPRL